MPQYDVAISFAGEDRSVAEKLAAAMVTNGLRVFYDEYEKADLWGKDLYVHLSKVYKDDAKFCLMLVSENYARKQWTSHERRAAQARAFRENSDYILPLRLDDADVDGLLETVGFLDYRKATVDGIVDAVVAKVVAYNKQRGIRYEIVRVEKVFAEKAITAPGGKAIRDSDLTTRCPACGTEQTLAEATVSLDDPETVYTCKNGCVPIVVVGRPGSIAWPGRGYRVGDYVIRNVQDIVMKAATMAMPLLINASSAALMKKRPSEN